MRKIALSIFLILAVSPAWALNLGTIETEIRRNVRDTDATLQRYSDTVLDSFINEAQREIVSLTWAVETSTSYVLSANTTYYALPTNFVAVKHVTFTDPDGTTTKLQEYSHQKVFDMEPDYEGDDSGGEPDHYFIRYPGDSDDALDISYLPVPSSSSTGTVKVWYVYYPSDLSSDSDVPFDGFYHLYPYHYAIVAHATAKIKAIEGKFEEAKYYLVEFERYVGNMVQKLGTSPNYRPSLQGAPR